MPGSKPEPEETLAQLADHEERIAAIEAAIRAFNVVHRASLPTGDGDER